MRALRLLPAHLPDLRSLARRDGFAARPHLPDEARRGRPGGNDGHLRCPLRPLSRLHGLRDRVPVRGAVRQADRSHARADRTPPFPIVGRPAVPPAALHALPAPRPAARARAGALAVSALRRAEGGPHAAVGGAVAATAPRHGVPAPRAHDCRAALAAAAVRPGTGRAPRARGPAARLRAAHLPPRSERGHGARPRSRRLRGDRPPRTGMLRRADGARRAGRAGATRGPATHRRVRALRGRHRGDERRRLRIEREGLRPPVAR